MTPRRKKLPVTPEAVIAKPAEEPKVPAAVKEPVLEREPVLKEESREEVKELSAFEQACRELSIDPVNGVNAWKEYPDRIVIVTRPENYKRTWFKGRGLI